MSESIQPNTTLLPVQIGALGSPFGGQFQALANAIADRLIIYLPTGASFWIDSVLPTANIGPGFLNGTDLYVWDAATGQYVNYLTNSGVVISAFPKLSFWYFSPTITNDPAANGNSLLAAYALAKASTPGGIPLSATNRAVVLVPPSGYNLGTQSLLMDAQFVDLIGMSTAAADQYIYSNVGVASSGVIIQTANDVKIHNISINNTNTTYSGTSDSTFPAAYFPSTTLALTEVKNCIFAADGTHTRCSRISIEYAGKYTGVVGGSGLFNDSASGTFVDCIGNGTGCFGGSGSASGTFINCKTSYDTTGSDHCFGFTFSGLAVGCIANGGSFGQGAGMSGTLISCSGGAFDKSLAGAIGVRYAAAVGLGRFENIRFVASTGSGGNNDAIQFSDVSNSPCIKNCEFIAQGTGKSLFASSPLTVRAYGNNVGNTAKDASITLVPAAGTYFSAAGVT